MKYGITNQGLTKAIRDGDCETLAMYLKHEPDLCRKKYDFGTVLHRAAVYGGGEDVYFLLFVHGGREVLEVGNRHGNTALFLARLSGNEELADILKDHGADATPKTMRGFNDLHFAARTGVMSKVINRTDLRPLDFHAVNEWQETPLDSLLHLLHQKPDHRTQTVLSFLLQNRAHFHSENGLWRPTEARGRHEAAYYNLLAKQDLLPLFFHRKYWKGIENEAFAMRERMLEKMVPSACASMCDFSEIERAAPAPQTAAEKFLRPRPDTTADRRQR